MNCDILSGNTKLISQCGVTKGIGNVTVQWYFSLSQEEAGKNGIILTTSTDRHIKVENLCLSTVCAAELNIINVSMSDVGYYWCKMAPPDGTTNVLNPSSVLNINGSCEELDPCAEPTISTPSLNNLGCAYGDTVVDDVIVVRLQSEPECEAVDVNSTSTEMEVTPTSTTTPGPTITSGPPPTESPITTDTPTAAISTDSPINPNSQQTSEEPFTTDIMPFSTVPLPTEDPRQTGPPVDGTAAPDTTSSTTTPSTYDVSSASGDGEGTTEGSGGLPQQVVWLMVGIGIAVLLLIIAVLLGLIVFLQCIKRNGKGKNFTRLYMHILQPYLILLIKRTRSCVSTRHHN